MAASPPRRGKASLILPDRVPGKAGRVVRPVAHGGPARDSRVAVVESEI